MATILDLFQSQKKDLYGSSEMVRIESRGLINPPRGAALLTSSPNALADLIGNQAGGALRGSANRPSDTIFTNSSPLSKPISLLAPTTALLRDAIDPNQAYFVKQSPAPNSFIAGVKQGGSSPAGLAAREAVNAVNIFGNKNRITQLVDKIKGKNTEEDFYGPKFNPRQRGTKTASSLTKKDFSNYFPVYTEQNNPITGRKEYIQTAINERKNKDKTFDVVNQTILDGLATTDKLTDDALKAFNDKNKLARVPFVLFQKYEATSSNDNILLPGTISGYSESNSPEWSPFKYLGSPFNIYKYGGVERTLSFELQLYYLDENSKITMKKNLDKLRKLVYPDENISAITYANNTNSPLVFSPNFVFLTISGLLEKRLAIITSMEISIDDGTPWPTTDTNMDGSEVEPYPANVGINFGITLIESPEIISENGNFRYNYNFNGPTVIRREQTQQTTS